MLSLNSKTQFEMSHGLVLRGVIQASDYLTWGGIRGLCLVHVRFMCDVPKSGGRLVIVGVVVAMHGN